MACDICGVRGTEMRDLRDVYKTDRVHQVCPECEKALNDQLSKQRSVTHNILVDWMKRFIGKRKPQR